MPKPSFILALEKTLGLTLHEVPLWEGSARSVMPLRTGQPHTYALREGHLVGLNLMQAKLSDAQWQVAIQHLDLSRLEALNLRGNPIEAVAGLEQMTALQYLDLCDNQLTECHLPEEAAGLLHVFLSGNWLLTEPPREVVEQGRFAIANYLSERRRSGTEKSLEAKVVLVGEGMAGKTSLRVRLLHGPAAPLPPKDERTKGLEVEIEPFFVDLPDGERLRLNLFDFGGQKHYKPLHQFFYSHRSLYVLVTRNGDDSNEFDYWFDTAQLFGGGSPVLVVNNLFGDVPSGFSRSKFARFDALIKDSLDTNLQTCTGFSAVKKRIGQLAEDLPHVHQSIPKSWANVRRALEALRRRNIIPLAEYLDLCARPEHGGMDRERAMFCSAYLHDIGACLHYQQFPALRRHVIVRNEWATEAVYRVMDDPEVNRQHGHFRAEDLERTWRLRPEDVALGEDFRYEDYQPELLELMRKFKLCYPLKKDGEFVAPSLLPVKQDSDLRWVPDNDLQFEVEYDFMPPGLFSRFVVSRYEDIGGSDRDEVWRDEVFFQWENARANVRTPSRAGKGAIVFRVQGRDPEARKVMLSALLRDLKLLHDETPGIVAEERIPCICDSCKGSETPTFYPHSELKLRQNNNKTTIECRQPPFAEQRIDLLLGNIFAKDDALRDDAESRAAKFHQRVEDLLAAGKLKDALELLRESGRGEAVDLLGQLSEAEKQFGGGRIQYKNEYEAAFVRILAAARGLLG